ncbi:AraC family transcriptional regulator [Hymenobacter sp. GOD-10R]|uniref:helix-turn-helix domain-containing protein n=1 Tax=Hymenobacter sp. GOD-10R TaxID=3093922 RepID=UPI002D788A0E|nr:AraC family transcriptional regulator [Hymenobacter sp. GOD-10R]WRQ28638.1 AraC family transcriptional regulator [Hymenobacter sp. GOD-10R]
MENAPIPTFRFDNYPQAEEPSPQPMPTETLEQLVVYRREDKFATCRQHIEVHRRQFYKLSMVEQGGGTFYLNDEEVTVTPYSVLLVKPGTALSWHLHDGPQTGLYAFFSADFYNAGLLPGYQLHAVLSGAAPYVYHACTEAEYATLRQSGEQLFAQQQQTEKARHHLRLLLTDLREWDEPTLSLSGTSGQLALVQQFQQLIEARLTAGEPAATLEFYADALCVTIKHLSALCRQATGQSAASLLKEKVMTEAKVLLTGTHLPVSELSYRLGFYDVAHFSRWFKQAVGQAPSAYRTQFATYK